MTEQEFRLNLTRAIAEDDFLCCNEHGELTNAGIDNLVNIAAAAAEELFAAPTKGKEQ